MWTYNNEIITKPKTMAINGVDYPKQIFSKPSTLESLGIRELVTIGDKPNTRYYNTEEVIDYENSTLSYVQTEKTLEEVKSLMFQDVKNRLAEKLVSPRVATALGYPVDGARDNKDDFQSKYDKMIRKGEETTTVKDADDEYHTDVPVADLLVIVDAITDNYEIMLGTKWAKEGKIDALETLDECMLYEATPYEYTLTEDDVEESGEVGDVVVRYTNQCKDW